MLPQKIFCKQSYLESKGVNLMSNKTYYFQIEYLGAKSEIAPFNID